MDKYLNKKTILIITFLAGVFLGYAGFYFFNNGNNLSLEKAGKIAIDFINNAVKEQNVTASLISIEEESQVYKIHVKIADQEYDSFITKDGKLLFSTAFRIEDANLSASQENTTSESELASLAQCLTDKGAKFYGAFWCSHCQNQKEMFGQAAKLLPYVECSTPDGKAQLKVCQDKQIASYPTWEFADGSRETGEVSLQKLSEKTGCSL